MSSPEQLQLLLEAPIDDAKRLRGILSDAAISVSLLRPENCGKRS